MVKVITFGKPGVKGSKAITVDADNHTIKFAGAAPLGAELVFGSLPRGDARRFRKALNRAGMGAVAARPRLKPLLAKHATLVLDGYKSLVPHLKAA